MGLRFENPEVQNNQEPKDPGRRKFLKAMAALAISSAIPKSVEAGITSVIKSDTEQSIPEILKIDISDQIIAKVESPGINVEVTPEYERNLSKLVLTIASDTKSSEMNKLYGDLLKNLPNYTEIGIIANEWQIPSIKRMLPDNHVDIYTGRHDDDLDMWSQDYGEAIKINGEDKILLPKIVEPNNYKINDTERARHMQTERNKMLTKAFGEDKVINADFIFEGGNMTFDKTDHGLRVFIGYSDIAMEMGNNAENNPKKVAEKISKQFGGAEVIVMGNNEQERPLVHIDQSFIVLDNKTVVINEYDDEEEKYNVAFGNIQYQHQYYRAQLDALGYNIISIKNDFKDTSECRSSVNAIPYVDQETGEKKIIFPVFPGEVDGDFENTKTINPDMLKGKALDAYKAFQKVGYSPIPVRDIESHKLSGNTHCLTNVLAKMENKGTSENEMIA